MTSDDYIKEAEAGFRAVFEKVRSELQAIRSNRPSVEILENIKVNYYEQFFPVNQLGSISVVPPRTIQITVWDKNAVGPVAKAIQDAKVGLTVSNNDNVIHATLPSLTDERRAEFSKLAKKTSETYRIQVRSLRDDAIKKVKAAEDRNELNEDDVFKTKERIQKAVDKVNEDIENVLEKKLKELSE